MSINRKQVFPRYYASTLILFRQRYMDSVMMVVPHSMLKYIGTQNIYLKMYTTQKKLR